MLRKIVLLNLFPYASRRVVRYSTPAEYATFCAAQGLSSEQTSLSDFNFDEGNGLQTEIVLNDPAESGNYLLAMEGDSIVSRWFVIEKARTTNYQAKQYRLSLRRDILADKLDSWPSVQSFVRKGTITDRYSPLLFNKEGMTFNAIKRREILLPDETGIQWIVGYIARNATLTDSAAKLNGPIVEFQSSEGAAAPNAIVFDTLDEFYKATGLPSGTSSFAVINSASANVKFVQERSNSRRTFSNTATKDLDGNVSYTASGWDWSNSTKTYESNLSADSLVNSLVGGLDVSALLKEALAMDYVNLSGFASAAQYAGRTVFIKATGRNYSVQISGTVGSAPASATVTPASGTSLFSAFDASVPSSGTGFDSSGTWQQGSFYVSYIKSFDCRLALNPLGSGAVQVSLTDPGLRPHLKDAPYDMFCIPYGTRPIKTAQGEISSSIDLAWAAAVALVENLASGTYDLQLLPYCPAREILVSDSSGGASVSSLSCEGMTVDYAYSGTATKDSEGNYTSFERESAAAPIIWCSSSDFSFMLSPTLPSDFAFPASAWKVKILAETKKARLVSPNLSGGFDFSPMMNGGVTTFRVDCTYRPFNPYIHVAPVFAHMYGGDFKDARGLVCGGDFSLPRITDAWEQYQQSNKNYQSIFDREIQNLEVTQKYQAVSEAFGAAAGVGQGAVSGALAGSVIGPVGSAVGGAVGGLASLAGGIADLAMGNALRSEAVDYRKDLFGYQLGNIRALPYSLAKSAAQNANNRPFPFIEVYTCSDEERVALANKIEYDGMSVGVIAAPADYIAGSPCFIQCLPCGQCPWGEDSDLWNALCEELSKGCYVYQEA